MQMTAYFDNSATTRPCRHAVERMTQALTETWGNPSSLYDFGLSAQLLLEDCRKRVARQVACRPDEVFFTSGGTEANNLALFGAAGALKRRGNRVVISAQEHSSILETAAALEQAGFQVVRLAPDADGKIPVSAIREAVTDKTVLVSLMLVNNETGAIQPVKAARAAITAANSPALLHCDCVQAFGKLPFTLEGLGADLLSVSGHKIHGPKGVGALIKRKAVHIAPHVFGGGQEKNIRPGTEAVPAIAGLLGALEELPDPKLQLPKMQSLWNYAREKLLATGVCYINSPEDALPYILNISVPGLRSETLLHFLEARGIYVSSGSACSKGAGSYVLRAMGLPTSRVDSALRISFCRDNTQEEVDGLAAGITQAAATLQHVK